VSGTVLLAVPARKTTPESLLERHAALVQTLVYPGVEWRLYLNEQMPMRERYGPNAVARNELIERYLKDHHDWVMWLDVDIVEAPWNLIQRLVHIAKQNEPAIVAPMVYVEMVRPGKIGFENGGWFYDTGGFQTIDGRFADASEGVPGNSKLVEMRSVGCVYLAPADVYRQGARYRPRTATEVEHLSFCEQARQLGTRVLATREIEVRHAYLPNYGERWHHND
jgi:GT2 family glycosyltransferase